MFEEKILYKDLSYKVVGLAMQVHTELGYGFLEKVYENALMILLKENEIKAEHQIPIKVYFHGQIVGEYIADIFVEDCIILELKAQDRIIENHKAQNFELPESNRLEAGNLIEFRKT